MLLKECEDRTDWVSAALGSSKFNLPALDVLSGERGA